MTDTELFDEEAPQVGAELKALIKMANELVRLEREVNHDTELLAQKKSRLNYMKTEIIPSAMVEAGLMKGSIKIEDGTEVKVEDFVSGSLPKDEAKRIEAIAELTKIGGENILKSTLTIEFAKSEHNIALDLLARLKDEGFEQAELETSVHPQTLMAFVREKLRNGEPVDAGKVGCFTGRTTKVKLANG